MIQAASCSTDAGEGKEMFKVLVLDSETDGASLRLLLGLACLPMLLQGCRKRHLQRQP